MCKTDIAVIAWLHQNRVWPPQFPRRGTLLLPYDDPKTPREEWGAEEWKAYALFLEESGASVMRDLRKFESDLMDTRKKLSRRKPSSRTSEWKGLGTTLLSIASPKREPSKRGRKPTGKREVIAAEVLAIRAELEADGKRVTDKAALGEWFRRQGKRSSRAQENRHLLNAISDYRQKSQKFKKVRF